MPVENRRLWRVGSLPGDGHQDGSLALGDVAADGLAGPRRVPEDAQHVVTELERDAQGSAVSGQGARDGR